MLNDSPSLKGLCKNNHKNYRNISEMLSLKNLDESQKFKTKVFDYSKLDVLIFMVHSWSDVFIRSITNDRAIGR